MRYLALSIISLVPLISTSVQADPYVGIGFGFARYNQAEDNAKEAAYDLVEIGYTNVEYEADQADTVFNLLAGYQFNRNLSFEAGFFSDASYELTIDSFLQGNDVRFEGETVASIMDAKVIYTIPFTEASRIGISGGMMFSTSETNVTGLLNGQEVVSESETNSTNEFTYGFFADTDLTDSLKGRFSINQYTADGDTITYFGLGVTMNLPDPSSSY